MLQGPVFASADYTITDTAAAFRFLENSQAHSGWGGRVIVLSLPFLDGSHRSPIIVAFLIYSEGMSLG